MTSMNTTDNLFTRHPKATIAIVLMLVFLVLDLTLGYFFCPKVVGTPDAYYHHDLPKNIQGVKSWGEREYPVFTNSLGFVDRERREVPRVANHPRILFLGDSFTEGVGHKYDETFVGLFASKVAKDGIEVLNAAVTSYSPKLYYLKTRYLLRNVGLRFDELIVCLDISDIQDEIAHQEFSPAGDFGFSRYYLLNQGDSLLKQVSLTYHALRSRFGKRGVASELSAAVVGQEDAADSRDRDRWTIDDDVYRRWGAQGLRLAEENMRLLAELCAEHGVKLIIVVYPWPTQIMHGDVDSRQVNFWQEFCARHQLDFINLFPAFMAGGVAGRVLERYFIPGDVHWNAAGHQLVADRIYEQWLRDRR